MLFTIKQINRLSILLGAFCYSTVSAGEWSGNLSVELRGFKNDAIYIEQSNYYGSMAFSPKFHHSWDKEKQLLTLNAFARYSPDNDSRTHMDIRELYWSRFMGDWELHIGVRKVFWGVTESQHLVDIVNQTDVNEGFDGEEKLGQPMVNFTWQNDFGTLDTFILTGFRPRKYPSPDARLRSSILVDERDARYESSAEKKHLDVALRWSQVVGDWDIGVSHFYGTNREPRFVVENTSQGVKLKPYYDIIHQTGVDLQATIDSWLWKLETIYRQGMKTDYNASTIGVEYSFFDIQASGLDTGIVLEYLHDNRDKDATTPFENDIMAGIRLALNDEQNTQALVGVIHDLNGNADVFSIEASRRLGAQFKLSLETYVFFNTEKSDFLHQYNNDDYAQLELAYFY